MLRKNYEEILLSIVRFDEADVITLSDNDYDNLGGWNQGWDNDDWLDSILGKK